MGLREIWGVREEWAIVKHRQVSEILAGRVSTGTDEGVFARMHIVSCWERAGGVRVPCAGSSWDALADTLAFKICGINGEI